MAPDVRYIVFMVTLAVHYSVCEAESNSNTSVNLDGLEVPDSSVLLLDRLNLRRLASLKYYGRQNQDNDTDSEDRRCICNLGVCKCCTGFLLDLINQKACMRINYDPGEFAFDVAMSLNDRVLYENSLSGKNPKPICINPPRMNNLKFCAKFYNVFFPGRNFHFCLSMTGRWRDFTFFDRSFDCLRMGANGIVRVKPEEGGGLPVANPQGGVDAVIDSGDDIEDYDENVVKSLLNVFDDDDDDDDDDD